MISGEIIVRHRGECMTNFLKFKKAEDMSSAFIAYQLFLSGLTTTRMA